MDKKNQIISEFEQVETGASQVALVMASYYKDLIKNGIPADLAGLLTQEFHRQWWVTMLPKKPASSKDA